MKILVIEDTNSSLKILCHHIEKMGIKAIPASAGVVGVDLFVTETPDLILLDIVLPDIDGFEVARRIRQLERPGDWTPIIFLTALNKDEDLEKGIAAGGDDYLHKPVSDVVLGAKIRAMQRIIQMRQSMLVLTRKLDTANHELKRLASLDGLTGIANRRHFDEVLDREWRRAMRQGTELSVLMCDVDFFKQYNDTYGHLEGDECLRQISKALTTVLDRGGDLIARYGGEEFAAVLPETSLGGALFVAERMKQAIAQLGLANTGSAFGHVTASFGIASAVPTPAQNPPEGGQGEAGALPESGPLSLVKAADRALYEAKDQGRNRVCRTSSLDTTVN
jgi:diguanylate cyclase (GGDEF)-like protein